MVLRARTRPGSRSPGRSLSAKPTYSYCVGVKFYVSEEEMADFARSENIFIEGFAPLYDTNTWICRTSNEQNHSSLPWLRDRLGLVCFHSRLGPTGNPAVTNLARWNQATFNYHPQRYSLRYRSLNEELDFNFWVYRDVWR